MIIVSEERFIQTEQAGASIKIWDFFLVINRDAFTIADGNNGAQTDCKDSRYVKSLYL